MAGNVGTCDERPVGDRPFGLDNLGGLFGAESDISEQIKEHDDAKLYFKEQDKTDILMINYE